MGDTDIMPPPPPSPGPAPGRRTHSVPDDEPLKSLSKVTLQLGESQRAVAASLTAGAVVVVVVVVAVMSV